MKRFAMRAAPVLAGLGLAAAPAMGEVTVDLGGGWQATIFEDTLVDLAVDYVSLEEDILVIEKFANFATIDPLTGQPDPVRINFFQTGTDEMTVSRIVIADEIIQNNSGSAFTQFDMVLMGSQATWNEDLSSGISLDGFSDLSFSDNSQRATFSGGSVPAGGFWTPGADFGELVIDIDLSSSNAASFVLKEIPTVPAPGVFALLGVAGVVARRRRRG